jgi:RHS repeat-associated protein
MYSDVAYAPYGETYAQSGTADFSFTGMNQDVDQSSNPAVLYDFLAREYGIQGRWPSPDPAGLLAVDPSNPQSWNRYAYVLNNPLALTDPTGMGPEIEALCATNPIVCIIANLLFGLFEFFGFGSPPIPQAAPAPPGGYGAGIDPYGTWDEKLPKGVQVFPSSITGIPNGSGCTYGSGSCGGVIYGEVNIEQGSGNGTIDESGNFMFYALVLGPLDRPTGSAPQSSSMPAQKLEKGIGSVFEAVHLLEAPALFVLPLAGSATVIAGFATLDVAACAPEPGALIACPIALATTVAGTAVILRFDYQYLKDSRSIWHSITAPRP